MQHQVPQFIDIEDKIFGPLTFKQFAYLAGGAGVTVMSFTVLPWFIASFSALPAVGLALALAFYTINGKPFIEVMEHAIAYFLSNKLYLWKQRQASNERKAPMAAMAKPAEVVAPSMTESKLKDLAWSLNIKERVG